MNKKFIIISIIVIVVVILAFWYSSMWNPSPLPEVQQQAVTPAPKTTVSTKPATPTNTFRSIFSQSGNYECLYDQASSSVRNTGVVHIADGKMRAEFRTYSSSGTIASFMIYEGGYLYSWKEAATVGTKSSVKSIADLPKIIPEDLTSGKIISVTGNVVGWDCHAWLKDPKLFTLPSYITF